MQPKQRAALTSESRKGGRERGRREGTVSPGQSGLVVAAGPRQEKKKKKDAQGELSAEKKC